MADIASGAIAQLAREMVRRPSSARLWPSLAAPGNMRIQSFFLAGNLLSSGKLIATERLRILLWDEHIWSNMLLLLAE